MADVPVGYVRITSNVPRLGIQPRLDEAIPHITEGYGGWEDVTRPKRRAISRFTSLPTFKMTLGIVFDKYSRGVTVEEECTILERMALPPRVWEEPLVLKLAGRGIPHRDLEWVIRTITWGPAIRRSDGPRTRQQATLNLMQYVAEDRVAFKRAAEISRDNDAKEKKDKKQKTSSPKLNQRSTYQVKDGDTLQTIANTQLGDYRLWTQLADHNNIRSSTNIKPGQMLLIP